MDHNNSEIVKNPVGEPCLTAGSWSQRSFSHSLQRAENLLRSTFNPSLQWLFHSYSQDEEAEEGDFVVAHNLTSRSSARLLRLQQALLTVAPQWQLLGRAQMQSPNVCVKVLPAEGGVLLLPSSSFLQGNYKALWRLLEQRSLLLFIHEYTKRARITAAYISRLSHLLEDHLKLDQTLFSWSSFGIGLSSLSQELRVHLNHWSCLFSKAQSDHYLRPALAQQNHLLLEIKQTLDLLGLQALVLMERYVYVILSAIAQTELDSVPREVLEDIVAGADLYNQVVSERVQHRTTQLRTIVLQQAHYSTLYSSFPNRKVHHPSAFSVKELMTILALHHADRTARQLKCWASEQSNHICQVQTDQEACACADSCGRQTDCTSCGTSATQSELTWEQLQHDDLVASRMFLNNHHPPLQSSSCYPCHKTSPVYIPELFLNSNTLENQHPVLAEPTFVQPVSEGSDKDQTSQCQTHISLTSPGQTGVEGLCTENHSSVELFFQLLISSNELFAPPTSHSPGPEAPNTTTDVLPPEGKTGTMALTAPIINQADSVELNGLTTKLNLGCRVGGSQQERAEQKITPGPESAVSSGCRRGDPDKEETVRPGGTTVEQDCVRWPHSVQWSDLTQSLVFADLFGHYRTMLRTLCRKALWLQLHVPQQGNTARSINLQDGHRGFQILHRISQASQTDLVPKECRTILEDFSLYLKAIATHARWDHVVCRSLGSALKDKCLTDVNRSRHSETSERDGRVMTSLTMEHFLLLSPPLLSSLCCHHSNSGVSGSFSLFPSMLTLQLQTASLAVATVQLSTVWVMSKAYQFLSSWSLNKFLLIVQGDLKVLRESLELMVHQTRSAMLKSDSDHQSTLQSHNQLLLRKQLRALDMAVSKLQNFSSVVLKSFSNDCKRMSGEIFQQTMPSAVHWRPSLRTGFPRSPSEYASLAAQTVIGQVLESVVPLSDDARVQTLSITMTAFMEAWMEHILKQKIKFSVQGALQLKQDFDSIRELIQSDKYGLSVELHQRLLSLRVFQQVDSAVVCLLQQPQAKSYLQSRTWEPFSQCCSTNISSDSTDTVVGGSITNLGCVDGEDLTTDLPQMDPSLPGEPYLAPSLSLGAAQQEWLDLRIHSNTRRWRLPGLQCLSKSEH